MSEPETYDAIVVGAGAAGCWAAKDLCEANRRVLLIDAGPNVCAPEHFPPPPADNPLLSRLKAVFHGQHIQARNISFGPLTQHLYVNDRENPYERPRQAPFLWLRGRQVGGRTHVWGRSVLRMSDLEFQPPSGDGSAAWPIRYADLASYYDRVESTLGVHGNRDGLDSLPDGIMLPPRPIRPAEAMLKQRLQERLGLTLIHNRVVRHNPDRVPVPLQLAQSTGRLTIRPNLVVSRVLVDDDRGRATGIAGFDRLTKQPLEYHAPVVLLCASTIETVRLLLNSRTPRHPHGLGGNSGVLGHYVCDHVMFGKGGPLSEEFLAVAANGSQDAPEDPYDFGVYSMYLPSFCGRWGRPPDFEGGYGLQIGCRERHWWALAFGAMQPRFENHVRLARRLKDAWGIPAVHIDVRHAENEDRMVRHIIESLDEITSAVGLSAQLGGHKAPRFYHRIIISLLKKLMFGKNEAFLPGVGVHETGGARMGGDPAHSVVNPTCQLWDCPNVFVTDGACFPSSGYQNHTLTIMALTARACDFIVNDFAPGSAPASTCHPSGIAP